MRIIVALALWIGVAGQANAQLGLKLTVNMEEAGTLFVKIQEQIDEIGELSDVTELTVNGPLNTDDFNVIRNQLTALSLLDMGGVTAESGKLINVGWKKRLKKVVLPTGATELRNECVRSCDSLVTVILPQMLTAIPNNMLTDCKRLQSITIPQTVTAIGSGAFYGCSSLQEVNLPEGIEVIRENTFRDCVQLTQLTLPNSLTTIEGSAFRNTGFTTFILPQGVRLTGGSTFESCEQLQQFTFPDGLKDATEVGTATFYGCDLLKLVRLPAQLTEIPDYFFAETSLESIDWPAGVTKIGKEAFLRFKGVKHITIPATVTEMGSGVFSGSKIEVMEWPASAHIIPEGTFWDARDLKEITIPETVDSIGANCFLRCYELKSVHLPEGIRTLDATFNSCTGLVEVNIPSTVNYIGASAFSACMFTHIDIPDQVTYIGRFAFENVPLEELTLPSKLQYIGDHAFSQSYRRMSKYRRVVVPEGVYYIGESAFDSDNLRILDLPATLVNLGSYVIPDRYQLDSVIIRAIVPPLTNGNMFGNTSKHSKVYVPTQSVALYKAHGSYNMATDILPLGMSPETVLNVTNGISITPESNWTDKKYDVNFITTWGAYPLYSDHHPYMVINEGASFKAGTIHMKHDIDMQLRSTDYKFQTLLNRGTLAADQIDLACRMLGSHYFTPAFDTYMSDIVPEVPNMPYAIYRYDSGARAAGNFANAWVRVGADEMLRAGQGYAFVGEQVYEYHSVYKRYVGYWRLLSFRSHQGDNNYFLDNSDVTIPVQHSNGEFAQNRHWNLLGMPFPTFLDIRGVDYDGPMLVWNSYDRKWKAVSALDDEYVIDPMHALFLQAPDGTNSITFSSDRRQVTHKFTAGTAANSRQTLRRSDQNARRTVYNLSLNYGANGANEAQEVSTRLVINPDATLRYDIGHDAPVMAADSATLLFTQADGVAYAINERPLADGIVRLGMQLAQPGTYALSLALKPGTLLSGDAAENVWLIDNQAHTRTLLLYADGTPAEPYTFTADEAGTIGNRFVIAFGDAEPTAISDTETATPMSMGAMFDLGGRRIASGSSPNGIFIKNGRKVMK